jgi:hypothetical protein
MLTAQIQSENFKDFERIVRESLQQKPNYIPPHLIPRYLSIANSCDKYSLKQSRWSNGCGSHPCSKKCMPRLENEVFMSEEESKRLGCYSKGSIYTELGPEGIDKLCFTRCGDCGIPSVDRNGSIDVRLLTPGQYEFYCETRPVPLFRKDVDIHTESIGIHEMMRRICMQNNEHNLAEKISAVI